MFRSHLTIGNDLAELPRVRELVRQGVDQGAFPVHYLNRLQIAVDEAITNIIEHGYAGVAAGTAAIRMTLLVDGRSFRITIEDNGASFDPEEIADVDIEQHVRTGKTGGLGVFLMRRIMDHIEYHYDAGKRNQLILVKNRTATPSGNRKPR